MASLTDSGIRCGIMALRRTGGRGQGTIQIRVVVSMGEGGSFGTAFFRAPYALAFVLVWPCDERQNSTRQCTKRLQQRVQQYSSSLCSISRVTVAVQALLTGTQSRKSCLR